MAFDHSSMGHPLNRRCARCGGLAYCVDRDVKQLEGMLPLGSTLTHKCMRCEQHFRVKSGGLLFTYLVVALASLAMVVYDPESETAWFCAAVSLVSTAIVVHGLFMHGRYPTVP